MISTSVLCTIIIVLNIQYFTPLWSTEEIYQAHFEICKNSKLPNMESVEGYLKSPSQCANKCNLQYFCNGVNVRKIKECMYSCELHVGDSGLIPDCADGNIMSETGIDCYIKRKTFHLHSSFIFYCYLFFRKCQLFYLSIILIVLSNIPPEPDCFIHPGSDLIPNHDFETGTAGWTKSFRGSITTTDSTSTKGSYSMVFSDEVVAKTTFDIPPG